MESNSLSITYHTTGTVYYLTPLLAINKPDNSLINTSVILSITLTQSLIISILFPSADNNVESGDFDNRLHKTGSIVYRKCFPNIRILTLWFPNILILVYYFIVYSDILILTSLFSYILMY